MTNNTNNEHHSRYNTIIKYVPILCQIQMTLPVITYYLLLWYLIVDNTIYYYVKWLVNS